ncbi:class II fructose-bisphosphate aldolase family protein [soil metagenome]
MALVGTGELIARATATGQAAVAFNVITLEHAEAIVTGAERAGTGVILQLSENAVRFHGGRYRPVLSACGALAAESSAAVALHLDHVESVTLARSVIADARSLGVGSLMVDASQHSYRANVKLTAQLARSAHAAELWVEAELGRVGGKDGAHAPGVRTDPSEAVAFVASTAVDALAVAVGSSHAMSSRSAVLDNDLIARLAAAVPVPLVLHGSSGVPDAALLEAVGAGIRKVNVGTALNVAGTAALRSALAAQPDAVDPRTPIAAARDAMADVVAHLLALLS